MTNASGKNPFQTRMVLNRTRKSPAEAGLNVQLLFMAATPFTCFRRLLCLVGVCRGGIGPARTEYYVVQDSATKKCTIVDKKPTTTTVVQVGPMAFKTRTEAEAGMKTITVCSSN